jgi:hypothetical protein
LWRPCGEAPLTGRLGGAGDTSATGAVGLAGREADFDLGSQVQNSFTVVPFRLSLPFEARVCRAWHRFVSETGRLAHRPKRLAPYRATVWCTDRRAESLPVLFMPGGRTRPPVAVITSSYRADEIGAVFARGASFAHSFWDNSVARERHRAGGPPFVSGSPLAGGSPGRRRTRASPARALERTPAAGPRGPCGR